MEKDLGRKSMIIQRIEKKNIIMPVVASVSHVNRPQESRGGKDKKAKRKDGVIAKFQNSVLPEQWRKEKEGLTYADLRLLEGTLWCEHVKIQGETDTKISQENQTPPKPPTKKKKKKTHTPPPPPPTPPQQKPPKTTKDQKKKKKSKNNLNGMWPLRMV